MEQQQQIPNGTVILVMGILSIVGCCCYGLPGIIFGIIAIVLASKATKLYQASPELYSGMGNVNAGKIMGIIGLVLSLLMAGYYVWIISYFGIDALQDQELMQQQMQELFQ